MLSLVLSVTGNMTCLRHLFCIRLVELVYYECNYGRTVGVVHHMSQIFPWLYFKWHHGLFHVFVWIRWIRYAYLSTSSVVSSCSYSNTLYSSDMDNDIFLCGWNMWFSIAWSFWFVYGNSSIFSVPLMTEYESINHVMWVTISDTRFFNKVIISRSKTLSLLMTDRCRVNCETGEKATPDLST